MKETGPQNIRDKFFDYIGSEESLANYSRSYKLVFLTSLFENIDSIGKAKTSTVANSFKNFYVNRIRNGLSPDFYVDNRIADAEKSSNSEILALIKDNPYNAIHNKGFVAIKTQDYEEYFVVAPELVSTMTQDDLSRLNRILQKKLELYYASDIRRGATVDLNTILNQILDQYYVSRTTQVFAGNPMGELFRNKAPKEIYSLPYIDESIHLVKGSVGQGNWASVPWICIFDRRVTTSAQSGVDIVYLLSEDGKSFYLTLNQGYTSLYNQMEKLKRIKRCKKLRFRLGWHVKPQDLPHLVIFS